MVHRTLAAATLVLVGLMPVGVAAPPAAADPVTPPAITHVWQIELENEAESATFGTGSPATFLNSTLVPQGVFIPNYYGTGHASLDNYLAQISGQSQFAGTSSDCPVYQDAPGSVDARGFFLPSSTSPAGGCVYPSAVRTLADQLSAAGRTWHGYMEDLGANPVRETSPCGQPGAGLEPTPDVTQLATPTDQYATRHNPFAYFHSLLDRPAPASASPCAANVTSLAPLSADLGTGGSAAAYSFITPNLCDDGHDGGGSSSCVGPDVTGQRPGPGGLVSADRFLQRYVPLIQASDAYRSGGLIVITFDEGVGNGSCCGEVGGGGGQVGALLIGQHLTPHTSTCSYNHFSFLRSYEDLFGLTPTATRIAGSDGAGHLAHAGDAGVVAWGSDIFGPADTCQAPILPEAPATGALALSAAGTGLLGLVVVRARRGRRRAPRRRAVSGTT